MIEKCYSDKKAPRLEYIEFLTQVDKDADSKATKAKK